MSGGARTSTCSTASSKPGQYRRSPGRPSVRRPRAPCPTSRPPARGPELGEAQGDVVPIRGRSGSKTMGKTASMYGCSEVRPRLASSQASSRYRTDGEMANSPLCGSQGPLPQGGRVREVRERQVHLHGTGPGAVPADVPGHRRGGARRRRDPGSGDGMGVGHDGPPPGWCRPGARRPGPPVADGHRATPDPVRISPRRPEPPTPGPR